MSSFKDFLKTFDYDNNDQLTKFDISNKYKSLNRFIAFKKCKTKNDLLIIIKKIKEYVQLYDDYFVQNKNNQTFFNNEQHKIITANPRKHIRVLACAGSGKTTVLIHRIKYLLDNFTTPNKILALSFNVDAVKNIKNKLKNLFGFKIKIQIYTIDALCAKIYKMYGYLLNYNYKNPSVTEYNYYACQIFNKYGQHLCNKYKYLFIDEYQDINQTQFDIFQQFINNNIYMHIIGEEMRLINEIGEKITFMMINDSEMITSLIALIFNLIKDHNYQLHDFAIISRHNKTLKYLEEQFTKHNLYNTDNKINYI